MGLQDKQRKVWSKFSGQPPTTGWDRANGSTFLCIGFLSHLAFLLVLLSLSRGLLFPHTMVFSPKSKQLLMGATLDNNALVEHHNLIGFGDGREAVGNSDGCPTGGNRL